jgi:protein-disulfide isomerase/uncharacterized membrane protein
LAVVAAAFGAVVSGVLLLRHHGLDTGALAAAVCDPANSGCEEVAASSWSTVAGVPLAAVGLAFFVSLGFLLALGLLGKSPLASRPGRLALGLVTLALVVDLFLFGVQAFAIGSYCSLCIWTYGANGAAFLLLLPARRQSATMPAMDPQFAVERFAVRAFWLAASLVAAAVLVINNGLSDRADGPADLSILGVRSATSEASSPAWPVEGAGLLPQWRNPTFRQQREQEVSLDGLPVKGDRDAPVKIVTFSDFLCPSCRRFALAYDQYVEGPTGSHVALYYRSYPLDSTCAAHMPRVLHQGACEVARGGTCANLLGDFWTYHDAVYTAPPSGPDLDDVVEIAVRSGLDETAFRACMAEPEAAAALQADIAEGTRLGVTGTPTVFINGRKLPSLDEFADAVLWELEKAGISVSGAGPDGE